MAGTDANIKFRLNGSLGTLETTVSGAHKSELEQGSINFPTLMGGNVGVVKSLTVTALNSDISSDWLPEYILVDGNLFPQAIPFHYGPDEWLKYGHPITKPAPPIGAY